MSSFGSQRSWKLGAAQVGSGRAGRLGFFPKKSLSSQRDKRCRQIRVRPGSRIALFDHRSEQNVRVTDGTLSSKSEHSSQANSGQTIVEVLAPEPIDRGDRAPSRFAEYDLALSFSRPFL